MILFQSEVNIIKINLYLIYYSKTICKNHYNKAENIKGSSRKNIKLLLGTFGPGPDVPLQVKIACTMVARYHSSLFNFHFLVLDHDDDCR